MDRNTSVTATVMRPHGLTRACIGRESCGNASVQGTHGAADRTAAAAAHQMAEPRVKKSESGKVVEKTR